MADDEKSLVGWKRGIGVEEGAEAGEGEVLQGEVVALALELTVSVALGKVRTQLGKLSEDLELVEEEQRGVL